MADKSSLAARRRLSLDISAASKVNDERIKVWTTQNINQQNGTSPVSKIRTKDSGARRLSLYVQRKRKSLGSGKKESRKRERKPQISEVPLTCLQKFATWRFVMVLLLQSSFVIALFIRNSLPMAIVCMARPRSAALWTPQTTKELSNITHNNSEEVKDERHVSATESVSLHGNSTGSEVSHYEFDWDPEVQGLILTSIMFTSFLGPLLGSFMINRLGCKWTLTVNSFLSTVLTFLSPVAARLSPYCLVAVRIVMGILAGGNVPVIPECIAWWGPQDEKLTMISLTFTGVNIGNILASFLSGYLCLVPLDNGWPFVFYTFGTFSLLWILLWHFLSSQKPEDHPYISEKEKQYIISHRVGMDFSSAAKKVKPPYGELLRSRPSLAYIASGTCHVWATQVLFTFLPMFFNKSLQFSVQDTGLLVSLTSTFRMLGTFFWTILGNKLSTCLDVKRSRKICICAGFFVAGVSSVVVGFVDEHLKWVSTAVLIFLMICQSVGSSTVTAVPLDMAPRYAGLLNGIMVSIGSLVAISGPLLTSAIIGDGTHEKWRTVWIIMGSVFFTGATIFFLFGQAALQPFAMGKESQLPHIVSPFVIMGRRFSAFLEAPPLSPVSPRRGFDFTQSYQSPAKTVLLVAASPEIFYPENFDLAKSSIQDDSTETVTEMEDSYEEENDYNVDDISQGEENIDNGNIPVRRRAFSEFGLEVLSSNLKRGEEEEISFVGRDNPGFEKSEAIGHKNNTFGSDVEEIKVLTSNTNNRDGVINEAFTDSEDTSNPGTEIVQISRL